MPCLSCGVAASRVHSTYMRRLADRPLGGRRVQLRLRIRRFFCDNGLCSRRTMAEQVPSLTRRYRRRTAALGRMVQAIGLAVGGRAGARLASYLPVRASRDVILGELRRPPDPPSAQVTVLGIDEFASAGAPPMAPSSSTSKRDGPSISCPTAPRTRWPPGSRITPESRDLPGPVQHLQPGSRPRGPRSDPGGRQVALAELARPRRRTHRPPAPRLPAKRGRGRRDRPAPGAVGPRGPGCADRTTGAKRPAGRSAAGPRPPVVHRHPPAARARLDDQRDRRPPGPGLQDGASRPSAPAPPPSSRRSRSPARPHHHVDHASSLGG
ncbi:transposase family protein [Streptomyces virginiae]